MRRLPPSRNFLIAAGLEQAIEYLEGLRYSENDIRRELRRLPASLHELRPCDEPCRVRISQGLERLVAKMDADSQ